VIEANSRRCELIEVRSLRISTAISADEISAALIKQEEQYVGRATSLRQRGGCGCKRCKE
jgi:hypothetical protein